DTRDRIVYSSTQTRYFRTGDIHDTLLRVVHHAHALGHPLRHDGPTGNGSVDVENLDPIVVFDAGLLGVGFTDPDNRAASTEREHQQVIGVGRVNAPLLVRGNPVQHDLLVAVGFAVEHRPRRFQVDRWLVANEVLAKITHPRVILVELLATGKRAPGNKLVHIGVTSVVGNVFVFEAGPRRRAD